MAMTQKEDDKKKFSHFNVAGKASMVDICDKDTTVRQAVAAGSVHLSRQAYDLVKSGTADKGDVLGVARIAGIMAAKKVDDLIPLTHSLAISSVDIQFFLEDAGCTVGIEAKVQCSGKTGVEMEALTAVSIAALTVYDMCKSVDKGIQINNIRLLQKTGGKSGPYMRQVD